MDLPVYINALDKGHIIEVELVGLGREHGPVKGENKSEGNTYLQQVVIVAISKEHRGGHFYSKSMEMILDVREEFHCIIVRKCTTRIEIYQTCTSSRGRGHLSTSIALFNVAYQQKNEQVSLLLLPAIDKRILTNAIEMAKDSTHH